MDVWTQGDYPIREMYDITMLSFFVHGLHDLCNIFGNSGMVAILGKGCKILLSGGSIEISRGAFS